MTNSAPFTVREYTGSPIYLTVDDMENNVYAKDPELEIGTQVIIIGLTKALYATVVSKGMVESENFVFPLTYSEDDRMCWVCSGMMSKKAIRW